jgi:hypothetical protein
MKDSDKAKVGAVTVGAAAAAAAAVGAYWLYGSSKAPKHRRLAKSWMLKARAEVMDRIEGIEDIDKAKYLSTAEGVIKEYGAKAGASAEELALMGREFKKAWAHIHAARTSGKKKPAKKAAKSAKKPARKTAPKKK